jgi:hypothetical protein
LRIRISRDPRYFGKLDPDPYQSEKLNTDPYQSGKQVPDPHQNEQLEAVEGHFGAFEGPNLDKVEGGSGSASNCKVGFGSGSASE